MSTGWTKALREGLLRARSSGRPELVALREQIAEPIDLFALFGEAEQLRVPRFLLSDPGRCSSLLALGAVDELVSNASESIADIRERASYLLRGAAPPLPLVGGFAFGRRSPLERESCWSEFANARFILPELTVQSQDDAIWLTRIARVSPWHEPHVRTDPWADALRASERCQPPPAVRLRTRGDPAWSAAYEESAAEIIASIRRGDARKVVLARMEALSTDAELSAVELLRGLDEAHPTSFLFAQGFGESTFLGASPERLVRRRGLDVTSSAVAGTSGAGVKRGVELVGSPKECAEHAFVVAAIQAALEELCTTLEVPASPAVLDHGAVQHLHTLIRGRLERPRHVLDILSRLHPTPAVGGTPRAAALELIRKHERFDRGWYAGPLGWFDGSGDGDFIVALRCGLLSPRSIRLYAGAGLVESSSPACEARETTLKLRALRDVLEARCCR